MEPAIELGAHEAFGGGTRPIVAMSQDGRRTLAIAGELIQVATARVTIPVTGAVAAALVEGETWIVAVERGTHALHRIADDGTPVGAPVALGALGGDVIMSVTRIGLRSALVEGERAVFVHERGGELAVEDLGARGRDQRVLIGGRGVAERRGNALVFRRPGGLSSLALPSDLASWTVVGGAMVLDGAGALIELEGGAGRRCALVYHLQSGAVRSRVRLGPARVLAVAERKGLLVLGHGAHVAVFDLRAGCCVGERILPSAAMACGVDADGKRVLVADADGRVCDLALVDGALAAPAAANADDALAHQLAARATVANDEERAGASEDPSACATPQAPACEDHTAVGAVAGAAIDAPSEVTGAEAPDASLAGATEAANNAASEAATKVVPDLATATDAALPHDARDSAPQAAPDAAPQAAVEAAPDPELSAAARLPLVALGSPPVPALSQPALDAYLADARRWIVALCRTALATAWDTGRIAHPDAAPASRDAELEAALGELGGRATEACARARGLEREAAESFSRWNRRGAPHVEVARELGLSPMATTLLLLAAAPQIWGELARAYGMCTADPARPLVDELLLAHLLEAETSTRSAMSRELDPDAPLVASGAVEVGRGLRPYAAISVHPAIARRLAGAPSPADPDDGPRRALTEIIGPRAELAALARRLAAPTSSPVRVVVRGRAGSGRRTIAAALAARAGRRLGLVPVDASAAEVEAKLRQRLRDVALRGDVPCVSIDDVPDEPAVRARIRAVLDAHRGPLFVRAPRTGEVPVAPGHLALELDTLTESERRAAWERTLADHALSVAPAAALASRFRVGPGAMARACAAVRGVAEGELEPALVRTLRQHRSSRIEAVAQRVERLASWDDLIVPDDISDALHELCARVHHRRTVLEDWGLDRVAATAQGVIALFQGGPGTGKTMAAEVVANALGYELWRVDLSKIVSKWIGETEKNLAAVFDAAEDGEIVLLFDEADSLFGKRTEVKSSHDRNANLETNYLLQRLDTFTGVAILTTNFGTSIDPAFRRRLSVQAQFPFPDESDRERLWRAHLPRSLPVAGDLELAELARRYELTGGYIRNAVLRAAYLAARRGTPLSTTDLERAVRSEYLARGKVAATGALN